MSEDNANYYPKNASVLLNEGEYEIIQGRLIMIGQLIDDLDLGGFLTTIARANAAGPIFEPTLWREANKRLAAIERMARVAKVYQTACKELAEAVNATKGDAND